MAITAYLNGLILCSAADTYTLPTAINKADNTYRIKNTGVDLVTVNTTGGQTIDGDASVIVPPKTALVVTSDNANWVIVDIQGRGYIDQLGEIATAPVGASQWLTAQIGVTGFFINWLQAGQNDFFQLKTQNNHDIGKMQSIADIHIHYTLSAAPAAGQTVNLEIAYAWVPIGQLIPLIGAWATGTPTVTFAGTEVAQRHSIHTLASNIAPPPNQTYSSILFIKALRRSQGGGADTYAGNFGLLYVDCHIKRDRAGSVQPTTD